MKKVSVILIALILGLASKSFAQSSGPAKTSDFFVGKWEFLVIGTPQGDVKFVSELVRKDGKLTGELSTPADPSAAKIPITSIEEDGDKIIIFFTTSGYDLDLNMTKVDADNLKGMMFNMFESKGVRIKNL